jgi:hypothetical protein
VCLSTQNEVSDDSYPKDFFPWNLRVLGPMRPVRSLYLFCDQSQGYILLKINIFSVRLVLKSVPNELHASVLLELTTTCYG